MRAVLVPEGGQFDLDQGTQTQNLVRAGRLIFGSVGALRGLGIEVHRDWGRRALGKLFPGLRRVEFQHEWYGLIGMTVDAIPRFHELARNTLSISGYNGRGIAPGTTFGRDLARVVAGKLQPKELALPLTVPQRASLRAAKESFYELGAQVAHTFGARI